MGFRHYGCCSQIQAYSATSLANTYYAMWSTICSILLQKCAFCLSFYYNSFRTNVISLKSISRAKTLAVPLNDWVILIHHFSICIGEFQLWKHESIPTVSLHYLLPYKNALYLHRCRCKWILSYWLSSLQNDCNDGREKHGHISIYIYNSGWFPPILMIRSKGNFYFPLWKALWINVNKAKWKIVSLFQLSFI